MNTELLEPDNLAARAKRANREYKLAGDKAKLAIEHAKNCGEELIQIKRLLGHGKFLPWLKQNFDGSDRTARAYMRIAENWQCIANLDPTSLTSALAALSVPAATPKPSDENPVIECEATVVEEGDPVEAPSRRASTSLQENEPAPKTQKPGNDSLAISAEVRRSLDRIENLEGLGRVAICDVLRYCCKRLVVDVPRGI